MGGLNKGPSLAKRGKGERVKKLIEQNETRRGNGQAKLRVE